MGEVSRGGILQVLKDVPPTGGGGVEVGGASEGMRGASVCEGSGVEGVKVRGWCVCVCVCEVGTAPWKFIMIHFRIRRCEEGRGGARRRGLWHLVSSRSCEQLYMACWYGCSLKKLAYLSGEAVRQ